MSYIVLENVCKIINEKRKNQQEILHQVSLQIEKGEMVAIIGRSGAGKTTLLNILGGNDRFTEGKYCFDGVELSKLSPTGLAEFRNQKIGFVLQEFGLLMNKSVYDNVILPLVFSPYIKKSQLEEKAKMALSKVDILDKLYERVSELSGGQKQRVAIARAFINDQETILADEPTGALDSKTAQEMMALFSELREHGKTIVIVTHDRDVAAQCDRKIELADGKIIE